MKVNLQPPAINFVEILRKVSTSALLCRIAVTVCAFQLVSCESINSRFLNSPAVGNRSTQTIPFEEAVAGRTDLSVNGLGYGLENRIDRSKSLAEDALAICKRPARAQPATLSASEFIALALPTCDSAPLLGVSKSGTVVWWDPESEAPFKVFDIGAAPKIAAISSHGLLAAQLESGVVEVWDIASGGKLLSLTKNTIRGRLSEINFTANSEALLLSELAGRVLKVSLTNENLSRLRVIIEGYAPKAAVLNATALTGVGAVFCSTWDGNVFAFKSLSHQQILGEPSYSVTVNGVTQARESQQAAGRSGIPFVKIFVSEDGTLVGVTESGSVEVWSVRGLIKRAELVSEMAGRPKNVTIAPGIVGILERDEVLRLVSFKPAADGMPIPKEIFKRKFAGAQTFVVGNKGVGYLALDDGKILQLNYGRIVKEASN